MELRWSGKSLMLVAPEAFLVKKIEVFFRGQGRHHRAEIPCDPKLLSIIGRRCKKKSGKGRSFFPKAEMGVV